MTVEEWMSLAKSLIDSLKALMEFIAQYGIPGILALLVVLIVHNPNRAEQLKALLWEPTYKLFKWAPRKYQAAKVGSTTTEFINRDLVRSISDLHEVKVCLRWVKSPSDPILKQDGTIVLRMQETNNQARNVLAATQVSLPSIVCPELRANLQPFAQSAVDLTILRRLAEQLGRYAKPVFQRYFLSPELEASPQIRDLFGKLVEIDEVGTFVSIFLEELNALGERLFASGDSTDKTDDIVKLLEFLLTEARRDIGEEISLIHHTGEFRIALILVAKRRRVRKSGIEPYLQRVNIDINLGCDSIYLIAFSGQARFLKRILNVLNTDQRLTLQKQSRIRLAKGSAQDTRTMALYRRNAVFPARIFEDTLAASGIQTGHTVKGTVIDVSQRMALVDVQGLTGRIDRQECAWHTVFDCSDYLEEGREYQFIVVAIDKPRNRLALSLRLCESHPWQIYTVPDIGDIIEVEILGQHADTFYAQYSGNIEVLIPKTELSWNADASIDPDSLLGGNQVLIYDRCDETHVLKGSIRQLDEDPWQEIHDLLPTNTLLRGVVLAVMPEYVTVELPQGLIGRISAEAMRRGAYEYVDFQECVIPGQGLDVVVKEVSVKQRRILLELQRGSDSH